MGGDCCSSRSEEISPLPSSECKRVFAILNYWFPPNFNRHTGIVTEDLYNFWTNEASDCTKFEDDLSNFVCGEYKHWD